MTRMMKRISMIKPKIQAKTKRKNLRRLNPSRSPPSPPSLADMVPVVVVVEPPPLWSWSGSDVLGEERGRSRRDGEMMRYGWWGINKRMVHMEMRLGAHKILRGRCFGRVKIFLLHVIRKKTGNLCPIVPAMPLTVLSTEVVDIIIRTSMMVSGVLLGAFHVFV